jgi:hypothetical protein
LLNPDPTIKIINNLPKSKLKNKGNFQPTNLLSVDCPSKIVSTKFCSFNAIFGGHFKEKFCQVPGQQEQREHFCHK